MRKRGLIAAAAMGVLMASSAAFASTTYDLAQDWSSSNPNGPWAYWQGTKLLPYQPSVVPLLGNPGFAPSPNYGDFLPLFWQTAGPGSDVYIHSVDSYNGNPGLGEATLTWTAPATGAIDVTGYLYFGQDPLPRSNDYVLSLGGATLQTGTLSDWTANGPANAVDVSFDNLSVTKGEILSLELYRTPGFAPGTEMGLDLTVVESSMPEIPVWAMLLVGFGGVGLGLRHRRDRAARCHLQNDL